jgi:predicted dehydrogenase
MPIRAAIVGLGRWGRSLVASVQGKGAELSFVRGYTRTRTAAEDFCRAHGVPLAETYEELLADPEIDAVVLATPHGLHESQIIAAAAAGKHIHVEKPITLDRAGADRAVAATRKAGVVLAVGYCRRFHPQSLSCGGGSRRGGLVTSSRWWRSIPPALRSLLRRTIGAPRLRRRPAER